MAYRVQLAPAARRELQRMPPAVRSRLGLAIQALGAEPRPPGVRKLVGQDRTWRIRVGQYRIVYDIHDTNLLVLVVRVARRNEGTYR